MTIFTAFVVVVLVSAICTLILIYMNNIHAKLDKDKYVLLSELGSKFNLCFSSHLVLGNKLIALDGLNKTLVIVEANNELNQPYIIELTKVKAVSIKKIYGSIKPGELRSKKFEEFLKRIDLQFEYSNNDESFLLTYYDSQTDQLSNLPRAERNAKNWQMILSKLVGLQADKINKDKNKMSLV